MIWEAELKGGKILNEKDNSFKDIDQKELSIFKLKEGKKVYQVDLSTGDFNLDGKIVKGLNGKKTLLYARRNIVSINQSGSINGKVIKYLFGYTIGKEEKVAIIDDLNASILKEVSNINPL